MSTPIINPKRFLLTASSELINMDFVRRIYRDPAGTLIAEMENGPNVELSPHPQQTDDFSKLLPILAGAPTP
jgi:hypothetical protein